MAGALPRSRPGLGPGVGDGTRVGRGAGVGAGDDSEATVAVDLGAVVTAKGVSVAGDSLTSATAQAEATRAPTAKIPTIEADRNPGIDNIY